MRRTGETPLPAVTAILPLDYHYRLMEKASPASYQPSSQPRTGAKRYTTQSATAVHTSHTRSTTAMYVVQRWWCVHTPTTGPISKASHRAHPSPNAVRHRRRILAFSADQDKDALARRRAPTVCIAGTAAVHRSNLRGSQRKLALSHALSSEQQQRTYNDIP